MTCVNLASLWPESFLIFDSSLEMIGTSCLLCSSMIYSMMMASCCDLILSSLMLCRSWRSSS